MADIPINDLDPRNQYEATASQTDFDYDFPIFANTELVVTQETGGVVTTLTLTTHYTVSDVGEAAGGTVTLVTGATLDDVITIWRDVPVARLTDYQQAGDFLAALLNTELDKIIMMIQQNERDLGRTLRLALYDEGDGANFELPLKSVRISKMLGFDSNGEPTATEQVDSIFVYQEATPATDGSYLLWVKPSTGVIYFLSSGAWQAMNTPSPKTLIAIDEGMVGDNSTDNTAAFNTALAAATAGGFTSIYFHAGNYRFDSKPNDIPLSVGIEGAGIFTTNLIRDYNEASTTTGFLHFASTSGRNQLRHINLKAGDSTTGGAAIMAVAASGAAPDGMTLEDINITGEDTGTAGLWDRTIYYDGSLRASPQGIRDTRLERVYCFNADNAGHSVLLDNVVQFDWHGGGVFVGGGATADVNIAGGGNFGTDNSDIVNFTLNINGELNITNTQRVSFDGEVGSFNSASSARRCMLRLITTGSVTNNLVDSTVLQSGGQQLKAPLFFQASAAIAAGATAYLNNSRNNSTEASVKTDIPYAGTVSNLRARLHAAPGAGESIALTLRKNGGDTALTITITESSTTGADTSNSVVFAAGDDLSLKVVNSGGAAAALPMLSCELVNK